MFREGFLPVEGGRVWYGIAGAESSGTPLLVLHGGPGYPHDYLEPLAELATDRPVIFYDQLGCGKSDRPDDPSLWQIDRFVRELAQVRAALQLERMHMLGHSWGTMLAVDYLLTGATVERLILASPALSIPQWIADAAVFLKAMPEEMQETVARHLAEGTTHTRAYRDWAEAYYRRHLCRLDATPEQMNRSHDASSGAIYRAMWGPSEFHATGNLKQYDRTGRLGEINTPALYTCGRYDEATPDTTAWYCGLTPNARLAIFEHSAHMAHLEETAGYIAVIREFLDPAD
jgi:proline iminopeptidase